jgi:cytochrome c oxidase subunit 2
MADPYAQDDIVVKELHIPKVKDSFKMRSQDVFTQPTCHILERK